MPPARIWPALLSWWFRWTCSSGEPPGVVEHVADDEEEPACDAQHDGHHLAGRVVFGVLGILPEVPIGRQQHQADRRDVLLEVEEALRLPIAGLLDRDADVDPILGVDV